MISLCIILPKFNFHFYKSLKVNAFQHKAEERANHSFYLHDFLFNPFMSTPLTEHCTVFSFNFTFVMKNLNFLVHRTSLSIC